MWTFRRNFASDWVLLPATVCSMVRETRRAVALLANKIGRTQYPYTARLNHGKLAFLGWTAEGTRLVHDGADSFLIRNGRTQAVAMPHGRA